MVTLIKTLVNKATFILKICLFSNFPNLGHGFFLYIIKPYVRPDKAALIVKPGKYAPVGNRWAPIKSFSALTIIPPIGPNK